MSKQKYAEPKADMIVLQIEDVLTASTNSFDGAWVTPTGDGENDDSLI